MFRVLALVGVAACLAGCGVNPSSLSFGFGDDASNEPAPPSPLLFGAAPSAGADSTPVTTAATAPVAQDKAPSGSFEKAAKGSLSGRDYSKTQLNPQKACDLINAYRRSKGLKPVTLNAELTTAAKAHARDLARWDRISHFGSDGSNPSDRVTRAGYDPQVIAENVGTGQATFEEVLKGWKQSPSHNKNLLMRDAKNMGVALVQDQKSEFKAFWTLVLATSM